MFKSLNKKVVLSWDGETEVTVYDGDVRYQLTETTKNPRYFFNENNERFKTRPYSQWTSMIARSTSGSAYQKIYKAYLGVTHSSLFDSFDLWVDWAEKQPFFMCTFEGLLCQLDKDLKGDGKHYSEDTCMFLPPFINSGLKDVIDKNKIKNFLSDDNVFELIDDELMEVLLESVGSGCFADNGYGVKCDIYSNEGLEILGESARGIVKFFSEVDLYSEIDSCVEKVSKGYVCNLQFLSTTVKGVGYTKMKAQKDALIKIKLAMVCEYKKVNLDNNFGKNFSEFFNGVYLDVCRLEKYL